MYNIMYCELKEMQNNEGVKGKENERFLYNLLFERFGPDCVYDSPKYVKNNGEVKELADIVILALPYAILFQMKWKDISRCDILGVNGEVEWKRVVRAFGKAAKQFNDFRSLWEHKALIEFPQQWCPRDNTCYELDLGLVKYIVPIAIVDFFDDKYNDPSSRIAVPPIVLNAPDSIDKYGSVHAFLLRDFERIINDLFTVGDLITYLKLREKQVLCDEKFVYYSEMDLFAIFLARYDIWNDLLNSNRVVIERGIYEDVCERNRRRFEERRRLFSQEDFVDSILRGSVMAFVNVAAPGNLSAEAIRPLLEFAGRVNCMTSLMKKLVSDKIRYNIDHWIPPKDITKEYGMLSSIGRFAEIVLPTTVFQIVVAGFSDNTMGTVIADLYYRLLRRMRNANKEKDVSEVLLILINGCDRRIFPFLRYINMEDYDVADKYMSQLPNDSRLTVEPILDSEWTYTKRHSEKYRNNT